MSTGKGFFAHGATMTFDGYEVGGLLDIPLPENEREEVEISDQRSQFRREYVAGMIDSGQLDITMRMVPGDPGQNAMRENQGDADAVREVVITGPDHMDPQLQWVFDAYVASTGGTLFWENTAAERTVSLRVTTDDTESEVS